MLPGTASKSVKRWYLLILFQDFGYNERDRMCVEVNESSTIPSLGTALLDSNLYVYFHLIFVDAHRRHTPTDLLTPLQLGDVASFIVLEWGVEYDWSKQRLGTPLIIFKTFLHSTKIRHL